MLRGLGRGFGLGRPIVSHEGEDLPVQVGDLEGVDIGDDKLADPRARQRQNGRPAHAADAADEDGRVPEPLPARPPIDEAEIAGGEGS